jgi:dethiobiotin synthetase
VIGLFITGTDTGCGKTTVACALARSARDAGQRVRVLKPVETGCEPDAAGELRPLDALALAEAAGDDGPLERVCPYRLRLPVAPPVAADYEGVTIDLGRIDKAYAAASASADLVLVEGAGGLRVPIVPGFEMADLALRLGLPLLVVCRARLGTLNHTLLTLEAAERRGLEVAGVCISHTEPELSSADRANLDLLKAELPVPCIGELGWGATRLEPEVDLRRLLAPASSARR